MVAVGATAPPVLSVVVAELPLEPVLLLDAPVLPPELL